MSMYFSVGVYKRKEWCHVCAYINEDFNFAWAY